MTIQEIKKSAKLNLKGTYIKCSSSCLLYFIIIMVLGYLSNIIELRLEDHIIPLTIIQAIFGVISIVLLYGLTYNILALSQRKTKSITKFVDYSILNFGRFTKVLLQTLIRIIVPLFIFFLCLYYFLGTFFASVNKTNFLCFYANLMPLAITLLVVSLLVLIYFLLKYVLVAFICYTDKDLNSKEVVQKSAKLMKGQKWNYIGLILSFFGWILLTSVILYGLSYFVDPAWLTPIVIVFYTLIRPYVVESESIFYESLGDQEETPKKANKKTA